MKFDNVLFDTIIHFLKSTFSPNSCTFNFFDVIKNTDLRDGGERPSSGRTRPRKAKKVVKKGSVFKVDKRQHLFSKSSIRFQNYSTYLIKWDPIFEASVGQKHKWTPIFANSHF